MIESKVIQQSENSFTVNAPTIKTMIQGLQAMQELGLDENENLVIGQLANGAGCFYIETLNRKEVQA
jgi:hypothetical protein